MIHGEPKSDRKVYLIAIHQQCRWHLVVNVPGAEPQPSKEIKPIVYDLTREMGGTVSAEHGIGTLKRDVMGHSRAPAELATMRTVKAALDPRGILNPGRSFAP